MPSTVKSIIDEFCDRINQPRESSYVTNTSPAARQYVSLYKFIGGELLNKPFQWPQLKRSWPFLTQTNVRNYPYPGDYWRPLESTAFDDSNQIPMLGPISDRNWAIRTVGIISLQTQKAYQIVGRTNALVHTRLNNEYNLSSDGYFRIDPPGPDETDLLSMGYLSRNWNLPASWIAGTSYTSGTSYVNAAGNIYFCQRTAAAGTSIPPSVNNGIGFDGGTAWAAIITTDNPISAVLWAASTQYTAGQYIETSTGEYYVAATGGESGLVEPTSTASPVEDGTVVWTYVDATAWEANTEYSYGDYVTASISIPGGGGTFTQLFMNVSTSPQESTSGTLSPNWYWATGSWYQVDGSTYWVQVRTPYDLAADTDICLFDRETMIEGLRWAWYRAKKQDFSQERADWEQSLRSAYARFEAPCAVNAGADVNTLYPYPNLPVGSWNVSQGNS